MKKRSTGMVNGMKLRIPPSKLRFRIPTRTLPGSTEYSRHRTHIIGQDRAIQALELGLRLESPGYNVFVSGPSGSGRTTTAKHILKNFKQPRRPLRDYVYIYNFQEPDRPLLLVLKPGEGIRLKKSIENLVKTSKRELPRAMASEACQKERERVISDYQRNEHELVSVFKEKVQESKFMVVEVQSGPINEHDVLPILDGEPQSMAALEQMVQKEKLTSKRYQQIERKHRQLRSELEQVQRRTRTMAREMVVRLEEIDRETGSAIINSLIDDIRAQFKDPAVDDFLEEVLEALRERIPAIARREEQEQDQEEAGTLPDGSVQPDPLAPFKVNVILNNERNRSCPVVFEHTPTITRLFGTVEQTTDGLGRVELDFMNIRAGSLLRADGGFLIVMAEDLLAEPGAWKGLKQTLSTELMEIRPPEGPMAMVASALKPDPIPLSVKIIMIGREELYRSLYLMEEDFKKTFKVKAEFDIEMDYNRVNMEKLMAFIHRVVHEEDLLPINRPAISLLAEEAMRDVEDCSKLTTRFRVVADLLRESTYWARKASRRTVCPQDLTRALAERQKRFNLAEEKYHESIERNVIMVDTEGKRVGQVNGLAVFDLGDHSFGKPCRITASVGVGRRGIINIEREAGLSGSIFDKAVLILSGILRNRYGADRPLALDGSVCFEQSYSEIDGDSASSAELYSILSCLSELPLSQGIAVTGSVNQQGDIQPIGGVNHKVEGFFDICKTRGLNGKQGVIIPKSNLAHLMLKQDVVNAVKKGLFNLWAVSDVDQGMELLTGVKAGKRGSNQRYPTGTINRLICDKLDKLARHLRDDKHGG